ncbi:MAG: GAF domain-containing protein [Erysipelotrichaceae bacterium]|nr:GAF domain-containing protein [Erysipelotrichaceae bacterium]
MKDMKKEYELLISQLKGFLEEEDLLAALCNGCALLKEEVSDLNWVGFYFAREKDLVLGPFAGKVACTHIAYGKGVCGTAYEKQETLLVRDVHEFPGHIACDSASNSEIVVPLKEKIGVFDIDSPLTARFGEEEKQLFETAAELFSVRILQGERTF